MKPVWRRLRPSLSPLPRDITEEEIRGRNILSIGIYRSFIGPISGGYSQVAAERTPVPTATGPFKWLPVTVPYDSIRYHHQ